LIVTAEIFFAVLVHAKSKKRLQKNCVALPGRRRTNARLRNLRNGELGPQGKSKTEACRAEGPATVERKAVGAVSATRRRCIRGHDAGDLSKISEINQENFSTADARAMLNTAVSELGMQVRATRARPY